MLIDHTEIRRRIREGITVEEACAWLADELERCSKLLRIPAEVSETKQDIQDCCDSIRMMLSTIEYAVR